MKTNIKVIRGKGCGLSDDLDEYSNCAEILARTTMSVTFCQGIMKREHEFSFFYYVPSVIRARGDVLFEYSCS